MFFESNQFIENAENIFRNQRKTTNQKRCLSPVKVKMFESSFNIINIISKSMYYNRLKTFKN